MLSISAVFVLVRRCEDWDGRAGTDAEEDDGRLVRTAGADARAALVAIALDVEDFVSHNYTYQV